MAMSPESTQKGPEDAAGGQSPGADPASDSMAPGSAPPESPPPDSPPPGSPPLAPAPWVPPTREYRAQWTFTIAAAFLTFAYVLILLQAGAIVGNTGGVFLAGALGIAVNAAGAYGLSKGRAWARFAMTPILWIYVGAGILLFVVALARSTVNIPIGAILAAWSLLAKPSPALGPVPTSSSEGMLLILGAVIAALIQFF
jgi:hypothetical protein